MNDTAFLTDMAELLEVPLATLRDGYDLGQAWDSLFTVSTISLIDKHYAVTVEPDELERCESASCLIDLIQQQVKS